MTDKPDSSRAERGRRVLSLLALRLVQAETSEDVGAALAQATDELFQWDAFHFSEHVPGTALFRRIYAADTIEGERVYLGEEEKPSPYHVLKEIKEGKPLLLNRADPEEHSGELGRFGAVDRPSASLMYVPVLIEEEARGSFSIQSYTPNRYSEADLELLTAVSKVVAPALRRIQAERALHESQDRYRRAIAQADAVPYERDFRSGRLIYMGEGIEKITGYPAEEVTANKFDSLIEEIVSQGDGEGLMPSEAERKARAGELLTWQADYRIRTRDGGERWVSDSAVTTLDDEGKPIGALGILQDITERMRSAALNLTLSRLSQDLGAAVTPREVSLVAVEAADELLGWDSCFLVLYNEQGTGAQSILSIDVIEGERSEFHGEYDRQAGPTPMLAKTLQEGAQLILREPGKPKTDPATGLWGNRTHRSESLMFVPIREKGAKNIGVLSIQSYTPHAYDEKDLEVLQILGNHCSSALERTRAEERLRRSEKIAATFASLGNLLNSAPTPGEAAHIISDSAQQLFGWDACNIDLYSPDEDLTYDVLDVDTVEGRKTEFSPVGSGRKATTFARKVVREGAFLLLRTKEQLASDGGKDAKTVRFGDTTRLSASLMFVPARKGDRTVGIISIQSYTPDAYSEEDLETFQALADHCGGALERIRTEQHLERERARIRAFAELGRQLSAAANPKDAGKLIVGAAKELIGWDSCFLLLYSETENCLTPVFAVDVVNGETAEVPHEHFGGAPRGYTEQAIREGSQLILRSEEDTGRSYPAGFGDERRRSASLMYAPILREGRPIGVVSIQSYKPGFYSQSDLRILESLAQHCSGALERIQGAAALHESEERYALAAKGANDGLWDWNLVTGDVYYSSRLAEMLGCEEEELGHRPEGWLDRVHPEDRPSLEEQLRNHLEGKSDHFENEHRLKHKNEEYAWVLCRGVAVRNEAGNAIRIAGSMTDITTRRATEDQLVRAAFHDSLTGLPNRALFLERLERCLLRHKRKPLYHFAVVFVDLDRFKRVNDGLGHLTGDKLLIQVGNRLMENIREGDTVGRMGGDEFTLLLDDLNEGAEAHQVAERIVQALGVPFRIDGQEIHSSASVGVALSLEGYDQVDDILRDADAALYTAKERGGGVYVVHSRDLQEQAARSAAIEVGLRGAVERKELLLQYQPIFSICDKAIRGLEALLRWRRPGSQLLLPDVFLPIAEETGLILPIGEWSLREACRQMADWRKRIPQASELFVSVNLSARQLQHPGIVDSVERILDETRLPPTALHLEIKEEAVPSIAESLRPVLLRWKERGIRILLDDFGSGYSALPNLAHLPVDYLKIDRGFVGALGKREESRRIVRAVLSLAHLLQLRVIAEGAETQEHLEALRDLECESVQGFYLSRPLDPHGVEQLLDQLPLVSNPGAPPGSTGPS